MAGHFHDLKGQMNKLREKERENLTKLTIQSNECLKELKRKADRVISTLLLLDTSVEKLNNIVVLSFRI